MLWLQERYISLLSSSLSNFAKKTDRLYNFKCFYCGDSKKSKKARGYLYVKDGDYHYKCHNCGITATFDYFLNSLDKNYYKDYKFDCIRESGNAPQQTFPIKEKKKVAEPTDEILLDKIMGRCSNLPKFHSAIKYLKGRMIPDKTYSKLFYLEDIKKIGDISERYKKALDELKVKDTQSIVFPIYNRQKKLVGVNTRFIKAGAKFRYVTIKIKEDEPALIFNLDNVNFNKDLFVLEGPFDSLFFDNSLAVIGSSFNKLLTYVQTDHTYFIFDNQNRNKEVVKNYDDYCNMGYKVFVWPESFGDCKDINDLMKTGRIKENELADFIKDNSYQGLALQLKLTTWKKV